ncbi:unnamed protein product [Polarella glacialis]|uniref:Uncharacterized protein n=1 Tax=Polarella glacialis TaxID=89957 RepID=A0A813DQ07_POLGL|nr:unnamed protein product [Polarella glacialis]
MGWDKWKEEGKEEKKDDGWGYGGGHRDSWGKESKDSQSWSNGSKRGYTDDWSSGGDWSKRGRWEAETKQEVPPHHSPPALYSFRDRRPVLADVAGFELGQNPSGRKLGLTGHAATGDELTALLSHCAARSQTHFAFASVERVEQVTEAAPAAPSATLREVMVPGSAPRGLAVGWVLWAAAYPSARGQPLECPDGPGGLWTALLAQVELSYSWMSAGRLRDARGLLADAIEVATTDLKVAHECSLGLASAYRALALSHAAEPGLDGRAKRRALQVALRFQHLSSNWLTHTFVKRAETSAAYIDNSAWPITLQESADEHRAVAAQLSQDGTHAAHRPGPRLIPHDYRHQGLSLLIVSLCAYPEGHVLPRSSSALIALEQQA